MKEKKDLKNTHPLSDPLLEEEIKGLTVFTILFLIMGWGAVFVLAFRGMMGPTEMRAQDWQLGAVSAFSFILTAYTALTIHFRKGVRWAKYIFFGLMTGIFAVAIYWTKFGTAYFGYSALFLLVLSSFFYDWRLPIFTAISSLFFYFSTPGALSLLATEAHLLIDGIALTAAIAALISKRNRSMVIKLQYDRDLIAAERNKLSVVLSGIVDGVIALDRKYHIILSNKAAEKITGWQVNETMDKHIDKVLHLYDEENKTVSASTYCPPHPRKDQDAISYSNPNLRLVTKDGKEKYVTLTSATIKEATVVELCCILVFHDLTEEQELERMKLDFVSMAAHELRTPLTIIRGYLSSLHDTFANKYTQGEKESLNRVIFSTTNLNNLIENLLNVARIEQGKMRVRPEPIQLEELVVKVVDEFRQQAKSKGLALDILPTSAKLPLVLADPLRIAEVLGNLLSNAINFTQVGQVEVRLYKKDDFVVTAIRDTGQGIPPESLSHLFTKFFRVGGELQAGSKGTGLGLYISKTIVQTHGGEIWAKSKVNVGTTIFFSLPIARKSKP